MQYAKVTKQLTRTKTLHKAQSKSRFFAPDERVFVLVGNGNYGNRRFDPGYESFCDLPAVFDDIQNMRASL